MFFFILRHTQKTRQTRKIQTILKQHTCSSTINIFDQFIFFRKEEKHHTKCILLAHICFFSKKKTFKNVTQKNSLNKIIDKTFVQQKYFFLKILLFELRQA